MGPASAARLGMTKLPSAAISAMGKPIRDGVANSAKPEKFPPATCALHSMRWPAATAPASGSQSSGFQPCHQAAGPIASDASDTRPQITISAPSASAAAIPPPPRRGWGGGGPLEQRRGRPPRIHILEPALAQKVGQARQQIVSADVGD